MTYSEKLRDPRWQKLRLEIMQRDEFACQCCGDKETTLHVHHRYYIKGRNPWEYPNWALKTLCAECHESNHEMDIHRAEGSKVPCEDQFETIFGFLGAGDEVIEGLIWDVAIEIGMLANDIGLTSALSRVMHAIQELKQEEEKDGR